MAAATCSLRRRWIRRSNKPPRVHDDPLSRLDVRQNRQAFGACNCRDDAAVPAPAACGRAGLVSEVGRNRFRVASAVPGRLRVRMASGDAARDRAVLRRVRDDVAAREGVQAVRVSHPNRSLTIHYDRDMHSSTGLLSVLDDVDVAIDSLADMARFDDDDGGPGDRPFVTAIDDLDRRIVRMTGVPIQLKSALPIAFLGAGLWSIVRSGLMIERIPGWIFLWLALDVYTKLHPANRPPDSEHGA